MATQGTPDWGGTPLATGEANVVNVSSWTVPAAQTVTVAASINVTRPGYVVRMNAAASSPTQATVIPVQVDLVWSNASIGFNVLRQRWSFLAGTNAVPHYIFGSGPTLGQTLTVLITNNGASGSVEGELFIDETTYPQATHDWRTDDYTAMTIAGWTGANQSYPLHDVGGNLLASVNALSVPAGTTDEILLPLYSGAAMFSFQSNPVTGSSFAIQTEADPVGALKYLTSANPATAGIGVTISPVFLPRSQCVLLVANTRTSGANTVYAGLTMDRV